MLTRKLATNESILNGIKELATSGGIGRNEYLMKLDSVYELRSQTTNIDLKERD